MSCKAAGGFLPAPGQPADGGVGHGVFDTLLDRLGWETLAPAGLLYRPRCPAPVCGERVERYAAHYGRRAVARAPSYFRARVPTRLLARVALDRRRRVAAEPLLYTVPVLSEASPAPDGALRPTTFHGEVLVPDDANGALLEEALGRVEHLGGGSSRGLGVVQVAVAEAPEREPVAERLEGFARALAVRRGQYARLAPQSAASLEGSYFSIDLRSDALLWRHGWEPTTVLDAELLRAATGVADPSLALVRAYAEPDWRGGWQAAWGLPRPTELVARRGSCYLYRTASLAAWTDALEMLETSGIGARTAEGYGEVRVCDRFHLVLRERAV
jgi:CRISPR-associated protein Csx10